MSRIASPRVNVTIDRLVLRGFAPGDRDDIAAGLETELARQLADPAYAGSLARNRADAVLKAGTVGRQRDARGIGAAAARTVVAGLGRSSNSAGAK